MTWGKIILHTGFVYKLQHKTNKDLKFYIGNTNNLKTRMTTHKSNCNLTTNKKYNYEVYKYIRKHGGLKNWEMIKLSECGMYHRLERNLIRLTWVDNTNSVQTGRTDAQYYQDNIETITKQKAELEICEYCCCPYTMAHKTRHQRSTYCLQFQE